MTRPTPPFDQENVDYLCVEPELGEKLDLLEMESPESELARDLHAHLEICHACRRLHRFEKVLRQELPAADWVMDSPAQSGQNRTGRYRLLRPRPLWAAGGAALALAACLLILLTPSAHPLFKGDYYRAQRSNGFAPHIERPIEGEMLRCDGGRLEWNAIPGAYHYRVTIERVTDGKRWRSQLSANHFDLPPGSEKPGDYIAAVEVVPANLLQRPESSVSFTRGSTGDWLGYRLFHPHRVSLLFGGLALIFALGAILRRF